MERAGLIEPGNASRLPIFMSQTSTLCAVHWGIGLPLNLLTIWMIFHHTLPEMAIYSQILLQTCLASISVIFFSLITQSVCFSDNGIGTVWCYGPVHFLPNPWQSMLYMLTIFADRFMTTNICALFIYRYLILNRNVFMTNRRYVCMLAIVTLPTAMLAAFSFMANSPTTQNEHLNNGQFAQILALDNDTLTKLVVPMRADVTNPLTTFTSTYAIVLNIVYYGIIAFCGLAIQIHIRRHLKSQTMVVKRQANMQISKLLIAQVTLFSVKSFRRVIFEFFCGAPAHLFLHVHSTAASRAVGQVEAQPKCN